MNLFWTANAWDDYLYWQENDQKIMKKINDLINDIMRTPFTGLGKPEGLKPPLQGKWSRRITNEHRLVYAVGGKKEKTADSRTLTIYQCRYHY